MNITANTVNGNKITVTIYKDTTPLFNEEEIIDDNMVDIEIPEETVIQYYNEYIYSNYAGIGEGETFRDWIDNIYTADEMDGLYDFAVSKGIPVVFPDRL